MNDDLELSREEKAAALSETLASDGWRKVIEPSLRDALAKKRAKLEAGFHLDMEQIRETQAEIRLLKRWLEKPREEFTP